VIDKAFSKPGLAFRAFNLLPVVLKVRSTLRKIKPALVHCHDAGGYAWVATCTGFRPRIVSAQGSDVLIHAKNFGVNRLLTKWALNRADLVHCDGYEMRGEIEQLGVSRENIEIVFFGTDVTKFKPPDNKNALKKAEGLEGPVVISTRRLDPIHNIETLIRAMPIILDAVPDAKFLIAGYGSEEEHLKVLSKTSGLDNSLRFLGMIEEVEMVRTLQMADVYVATSLSESGIAASTAEAMACELPVVSTEVGDIRRWVIDGENGYVIPQKDTMALGKRIIYLLNNEKERTRFGKLNRKIIEERNNYFLEMDKMEKIYSKLVHHYAGK
jgi:glycosyltransferase involved in cell wall biosynthesis